MLTLSNIGIEAPPTLPKGENLQRRPTEKMHSREDEVFSLVVDDAIFPFEFSIEPLSFFFLHFFHFVFCFYFSSFSPTNNTSDKFEPINREQKERNRKKIKIVRARFAFCSSEHQLAMNKMIEEETGVLLSLSPSWIQTEDNKPHSFIAHHPREIRINKRKQSLEKRDCHGSKVLKHTISADLHPCFLYDSGYG